LSLLPDEKKEASPDEFFHDVLKLVLIAWIVGNTENVLYDVYLTDLDG